MREDVVQQAREFLSKDPVFLDTETTGLGSRDEIVEIAIVDVSGSVILQSLIKPTILIPPEATAIHGITQEHLLHAPLFPDLQRAIEVILHHSRVGIYNASFDTRILRQSARAWDLMPCSEIDSFCVMRMFAELRGEWNLEHRSAPWISLEAAARMCGIKVSGNHRAVADADLARRLLIHLAGKSTKTHEEKIKVKRKT